MEVILLKDVKKLGKKGELADVSDGYARNYLIKNNLAEQATAGAKKELKAKKKAEKREEQEELEEAKEYKKILEDNKVEVKEKAAEDGRLFGSVTTKKIAEEVEKQLDIKLDKRKIDQKVQMRAVGSQTVQVKLHNDVTADLDVEVIGIES